MSLCVLNVDILGRQTVHLYYAVPLFPTGDGGIWYRGGNKKNEPRSTDEVIWFARAVLLRHSLSLHLLGKQVFVYLIMRETSIREAIDRIRCAKMGYL